jgi:CHAP domain
MSHLKEIECEATSHLVEWKQQLLEIAASYVGVHEQGGTNRGPEVEQFQKAVNGKASYECWCMGFAQFCIKAIEAKTQMDSQVFKSESCLQVWNKSPKDLRLTQPEPGSLVIWQRGNTGRGHVGIVENVSHDGTTFSTIEGNVRNPQSPHRKRDGVYRRNRSIEDVGKMRLKGFIRIF